MAAPTSQKFWMNWRAAMKLMRRGADAHFGGDASRNLGKWGREPSSRCGAKALPV